MSAKDGKAQADRDELERFVAAYHRCKGNLTESAIEIGVPDHGSLPRVKGKRLYERAVKAGLLEAKPGRPQTTEAERRFAEQVIVHGGNQTKAVEALTRAGVLHIDPETSTTRVTGSRLAERAPVPETFRAIVAEMDQQTVMSAQEVIMRMTAIGRGDIGIFTKRDHNGTVTVDLDSDEAKAGSWLIQEISIDEGCGPDGMPWSKIKIKLHDKLRAIVTLGQMWGIDKPRGGDDDERSRMAGVIAGLMAALNMDELRKLREIAASAHKRRQISDGNAATT